MDEKEKKAASQKKWYEANKEIHLRNVARNRARYRERGKNHVLKYLQDHPCVDCGESDMEVLEFDHKEMLGDHSARRVSSFLANSLARLQAEINKCDVRCANCHLRRTRKQMGWERTLDTPPLD